MTYVILPLARARVSIITSKDLVSFSLISLLPPPLFGPARRYRRLEIRTGIERPLGTYVRAALEFPGFPLVGHDVLVGAIFQRATQGTPEAPETGRRNVAPTRAYLGPPIALSCNADPSRITKCIIYFLYVIILNGSNRALRRESGYNKI